MTLGQGVIDWKADGFVLSAAQKKHYEEEGFIVIRNVIPQYELDRYKKRFQEICEKKNVPPTMTVMRDIQIAKSEYVSGEKAIMKLQDFGDDPILFDYCKHPAIVDTIKDLIGTHTSNLLAMHTMLINKPPDSGSLTSRHPMHQDLQYFPFRPADFICCAWTAMERVNRANGCLVVVPRTHKGELLPHGYPDWEGGVNPIYHGIQNYDASMPRIHVEMEPGDTVFFHPLLIHGSGANRTQGFRKAISCHYANDDMCRYVDVSNTSQDVTSKEIIDIAKKKMKKYGLEDADNQKIDYAADDDAGNDDDDLGDTTTFYEECAKYIMETYRSCVTDSSKDPNVTKKVAMLNMTNQLFRIYFKINKLNLLKPLIRAIDNAGPAYTHFSMADKVTYKYFLGRKAMFDADLVLAEQSLSYAFRNCPADHAHNKKLILVYLIPVKMFLGHMPSQELLRKYQLDSFIEVVEAVKEGHLSQLDSALQTHEEFFIRCGIFLMLEKLRAITFRTLFKKVSHLIGDNKVPLKAFSTALKFQGITDIEDDELACIVANLIAEKKIRGYISHVHQMVVLSKVSAFPTLSSIATSA